MSPVGRKGRLEPAGVGRNGRGVLEGMVLGIEPMAPSMLGKHSATDLHLHSNADWNQSITIMEGLAVCPCPAETARLQYCVWYDSGFIGACRVSVCHHHCFSTPMGEGHTYPLPCSVLCFLSQLCTCVPHSCLGHRTANSIQTYPSAE